jgi:phospholipase/carboxylesterase
MLPFEPATLPDLAGVSIFIGAGRRDPLVDPVEVERLAAILADAGSDVTVHWENGGHTITETEIGAARTWLNAATAP